MAPRPAPEVPDLASIIRGIRIDQPLLHQRIAGENTACGIAAGIGHQPGSPDLLPVDLAQAVDCLRQKLGGLVGDFIPLFVNRHIFQPEIGAQIDDFTFGKNPFIYQGSTQSLRRGGEKSHPPDPPGPPYCHPYMPRPPAGKNSDKWTRTSAQCNSGSKPPDFRIFMSQKDSDQLCSRIACRSDYSCSYHNNCSFS